MAKSNESSGASGQKETLAGYRPSDGRKMESNVGEYQTPCDPKSTNR